MRNASPEQRFWSKVVKTEECWDWIGAVSANGYGVFGSTKDNARHGIPVIASRAAWHLTFGPIPDGLQVNHKDLDRTNNRLSNLELLDQSGNIRHSYANGRRRPWSEATEWRPGIPRITEQVKEELARLRTQGFGAHRISKRLGISRTHAQRLIDALEAK